MVVPAVMPGRRLRTRLAAFAVVLAVFGPGSPSTAMAWGDQGHQVIALIAYDRLTPAVRRRVDELLASDTDTLTAPDFVSRSNWADRYRDSDRNAGQLRYLATRAWHFADIEIDGGSLGEACPEHTVGPDAAPPVASAGPADDCVVRKVDQFAAELGDPATALAEQRLALKFLVHFVGDLHQPLHAADHHDAGGNTVRVLYPGIAAASNLHAYWDTRLVRLLGTDPKAVAAELAASISPAQARSWIEGSPASWAVESFAQARAVVYPLADQPRGTDATGIAVIELGPGYDARALPVVRTQLARAAVRLAAVLEQALR